MEIIIKFAPLALFFIMFCLGLNVKLFDFINIFKSPKNLLIGLFSQSIILPLVGFLFALIAEVDEQIKIGIILIKIFSEKSKSWWIVFFLDKFGSKKALKLFDIILSLPVNCCGTEYDAKAIGPKNIFIKYLSNKS